ncbi:homeobox protein CDX-4-like [Mytilus galloprovincialis]|uniref:homeobox protein CDX-4-like n=1 Tax=Mytilus galloprovincialis TaxID=29158 RepID=UPI003F7C602A
MVLCQETPSNSMYQTRTSPPANYNFGHFQGYVGQNGHYAGQPHGFEQFNIDPSSAFQQAQCYPMYGPGVSRPEEWNGTGNMNYSPLNNASGTVSPHSMNAMYQYRNDYVQTHCGNGNMNNMSTSPQPTGSPTTSTGSSGSNGSPSNKQIRPPYDWMKKTSYVPTGPQPGKTRTKDKYRVVYSDHQRLELEKEFHYSRYITIRRKAELAQNLGLSERQVKIWFQNRRAKERKQNKKRGDDIKIEEYHNETSGHIPNMQHQVHSSQTPTMQQVTIKQDPIDDYPVPHVTMQIPMSNPSDNHVSTSPIQTPHHMTSSVSDTMTNIKVDTGEPPNVIQS